LAEATMQEFTNEGNQAIQALSQRYGISTDAVKTMLFAVNAGGGTMAQFYCSELGGGGQWMRGGMTMVGDMFNHGLQATVSNLCSELAQLLASTQVLAPVRNSFGNYGNTWWPAELGSPSSSGGQNDARYAYFPQAQRLAIDRGGQVTLYDTLDHQIGGVQQQQGGAYGSLSFSSQFGTFTVDSLPRIGAPNAPQEPPAYSNPSNSDFNSNSNANFQQPFQPQAPAWQGSSSNNPQTHDEILGTLERLSDLHKKGILSEDEFRAKKADLLGRL
jgi:hypothetical protein